jgi:hypothetical protein
MDTNFITKELGLRHQNLPSESWKEVVSGNGTYYISDLGRLLTTNHYGSGKMAIMKPALDGNGYFRTAIVKKDRPKKSSTIKVHRLVAEAFVPNPTNLPEVNHKDGVKVNNVAENLEWVTHRQNIQHSFANKLQTNIGSKNPISKLTEKDVAEIRRVPLPLTTQKRIDLAAKYGVAIGTIKHIVYRQDKCWIHVK